MAARLLGRAPCPECGFGAAHVRQNEGKHPYRYCPECGANYATRNTRQANDLLAKVRPEQGAPAPNEPRADGEAGTPAGQGAVSAPPPAAEKPAPRRVGLWEQMVGGAR